MTGAVSYARLQIGKRRKSVDNAMRNDNTVRTNGNHRRHCIYYFPRFSIIWARQFCVATTAIESRYNLREWLRRVPVFARRFTLCAASIWTAAAFPCRCGQIKTERLYCDLCVVPWHLAHTVVLCHLALLVSFGLSHDS